MSVYKLYAVGTGGTENSLAALDIQFDGVITSIFMTMIHDGDANDEFANAEVSFLSTNTMASNDARGSLMIIGTQMGLTTSGVATNNVNASTGPVEIAVVAGERVHLHISASAGLGAQCQCYLYVVDGQAPALRRRR